MTTTVVAILGEEEAAMDPMQVEVEADTMTTEEKAIKVPTAMTTMTKRNSRENVKSHPIAHLILVALQTKTNSMKLHKAHQHTWEALTKMRHCEMIIAKA